MGFQNGACHFGKNEISGKDTKWSSWKAAGHQTWSGSFSQFIYIPAGVEIASCAIKLALDVDPASPLRLTLVRERVNSSQFQGTWTPDRN